MMTQAPNPIPEGYHTLSPYLIVRGASEALEFYKQAFGANEICRLDMPDGKIGHGEFKIGDSIFMISDESPQCTTKSPEALGGSSVTLHLYVVDADATFKDALKAGAKETMPIADQFWGDRMGGVVDPFGHNWMIATHIEDVDPSEFQSRMEACFEGKSA
jgi:PhnB protein